MNITRFHKQLKDAKKRIKELETMLFEYGAMEDPPCFICGYNGPGYFNSSIHKCADKHHGKI